MSAVTNEAHHTMPNPSTIAMNDEQSPKSDDPKELKIAELEAITNRLVREANEQYVKNADRIGKLALENDQLKAVVAVLGRDLIEMTQSRDRGLTANVQLGEVAREKDRKIASLYADLKKLSDAALEFMIASGEYIDADPASGNADFLVEKAARAEAELEELLIP